MDNIQKNNGVSDSSIRRAITIIQKAGLITNSGYKGDDFVNNKTSILIKVDSSLVVPIRRQKTYKKIRVNEHRNNQ